MDRGRVQPMSQTHSHRHILSQFVSLCTNKSERPAAAAYRQLGAQRHALIRSRIARSTTYNVACAAGLLRPHIWAKPAAFQLFVQ